MGITIGPEAHAFAVRRDQVRIERSELRASEASQEVVFSLVWVVSSDSIQYPDTPRVIGVGITPKHRTRHPAPCCLN